MKRQGAPVDCRPDRLQQALDILRSGGDLDRGAGLLWRCYYRNILGFFLRKSRGSPESEDLTQNVFLNVFSRGPKCPADLEGFNAYLLKAARNAYLDALRRRPEWLSLEDHPTLVEKVSEPPAPSQEDEAISQERARKVQTALSQLSPSQRLCISLYSEGWKPREIANLRGCKEGTVKALLQQGLARLRLLLPGDFDDFDVREDD